MITERTDYIDLTGDDEDEQPSGNRATSSGRPHTNYIDLTEDDDDDDGNAPFSGNGATSSSGDVATSSRQHAYRSRCFFQRQTPKSRKKQLDAVTSDIVVDNSWCNKGNDHETQPVSKKCTETRRLLERTADNIDFTETVSAMMSLGP